jgi:hypothetical protein
MHLAPCDISLCPNLMHPAPLLRPKLHIVQSHLTAQDGHQDLLHTPRRHNRDSGRNASGGGHHHNPSHSCSPIRRTPHTPTHQRHSPPSYSQHQSPSKNQAFQPSTTSQGPPVCALCLATDPHDTGKCRSETLWDGSKARCHKGGSSPLQAPLYAVIGTTTGAAQPALTSNDTSVPGVETRITELRGALELRRNQALTPYRWTLGNLFSFIVTYM